MKILLGAIRVHWVQTSKESIQLSSTNSQKYLHVSITKYLPPLVSASIKERTIADLLAAQNSSKVYLNSTVLSCRADIASHNVALMSGESLVTSLHSPDVIDRDHWWRSIKQSLIVVILMTVVVIWRIEIDWIQILIKKYDQIAKRHLSKGWWNEKSHLVVNNSLQLNPNCRHYVITL